MNFINYIHVENDIALETTWGQCKLLIESNE